MVTQHSLVCQPNAEHHRKDKLYQEMYQYLTANMVLLYSVKSVHQEFFVT